jgi:hypothetical protein
MDKILNWLTKSAAYLLWLCVGVLIGLLWKYPANWIIHDPTTANIIGGIIGAAGTVVGAFLVLAKQLNNEQTQRKTAQAIQKTDAEDRLFQLRTSVANALYTDLKATYLLIEKSRIVAIREEMTDSERKKWLQRMERIPVPSFDQFVSLLPQLGYPVGPTAIHAYGEVMRIRSFAQGQAVTNDTPTDNAEFIQVLLKLFPAVQGNLLKCMDELWDFTRFEPGSVKHHREHGALSFPDDAAETSGNGVVK